MADVEHLDDVRVLEEQRQPRLVQEHRDELLVFGERRQDPLDGDDLLEPLDTEGLRLEDLGHPAHADALEQEILAERNGLTHGN